MGKKRILYIMGIDWDWIRQRPQIFAEKLSRDYRVTVLYPRSIFNLLGKKKTEVSARLESRILWTIPYQEKNRLVGKIANRINKRLFGDIHSFEYIYIGYPLYARYIPESYSGRLIYDCMDNHEVLYPYPKGVGKVIRQEKTLIKKCHMLIVSSQLLAKKANETAGYAKSILIRNALDPPPMCHIKEPRIQDTYRICYFGTISNWFDYDILQYSIRQINDGTNLPRLHYYLIGPAQKKISHPDIQYVGIVKRDELYDTIRDYDCLIMPFKVNDVVTSVDPVKLYEYIAFGKCIISVYYPEIEQFRDFVYFYDNPEGYVELLRSLMASGFPPKYTSMQQKRFVEENTWDKRYEALKNGIILL